MSRVISEEALQSVFAQETDDAFLILLTINHAGLETPIRVTNNTVDVFSRGETFIAFPFEICLPDDEDEKTPRARLVMDNVERTVVQTIRGLASPPSVLIEIIRAADPESVEARFEDFKFTDISYDSKKIEGNLGIEDFTTEPFPAGSFCPSLFPGIF